MKNLLIGGGVIYVLWWIFKSPQTKPELQQQIKDLPGETRDLITQFLEQNNAESSTAGTESTAAATLSTESSTAGTESVPVATYGTIPNKALNLALNDLESGGYSMPGDSTADIVDWIKPITTTGVKKPCGCVEKSESILTPTLDIYEPETMIKETFYQGDKYQDYDQFIGFYESQKR